MQPSRHHKSRAYAWAVVAVWLAGTAYAFWSFELKHQRSFESARTVLFDSGSRARSAESWFRTVVAPNWAPRVAGSRPLFMFIRATAPAISSPHPHLARICRGLSTARCEFHHSGARLYYARGRRTGVCRGTGRSATGRVGHRWRPGLDRGNTGGTGFRRRRPARLLRSLQRQRPLRRVGRPGGACSRAGYWAASPSSRNRFTVVAASAAAPTTSS